MECKVAAVMGIFSSTESQDSEFEEWSEAIAGGGLLLWIPFLS